MSILQRLSFKNKYFVLMSREKYDEIKKIEKTSNVQKGYKAGYKDGVADEKKKMQHTPGWLKKEVHRKLDLMFKNDGFSDRARYRWLKEHTLTTSHMSQMGMRELQEVNKMLNEVVGEGKTK